MFGCCPGVIPSSDMLRDDRPMDPAKDLLLVFWGMNEIMVYDENTKTMGAMPCREPFPPSLVKEMIKLVKVAKRFPRAVLFLGDFQDV